MLKPDTWIASTTVHRLLTALVMTAQVLSVAHTNLAALAAPTAHVREPRWKACCFHRGRSGLRACSLNSGRACCRHLTAQVYPTAHVGVAALAMAALAIRTALVLRKVWACCHDSRLHCLCSSLH